MTAAIPAGGLICPNIGTKLEPNVSFTPDAKFDPEGFRNMLALRAEIERRGDGEIPASESYVDLRYYEAAMRRLRR